ncbi:MAG: SH3 domain-containing protein [Deltaproteobacteria bacterium]|nr:MAG: SH3 domain-containing protein [Deltaproteobacteria bacterium]
MFAIAAEDLADLGGAGASDGEALYLPDDADIQTVAHELVHWLQDGGGGEASISSPGDDSEDEARDLAARATRGEPVRTPQARRTSAVSLDHDPPNTSTSPDTSLPTGGSPVNKLAIVAWDGSPALRLRRSPEVAPDNIAGHLDFNTVVQVLRRFDGGWVYVSTPQGQTGYCAETYLWSAPEHPLPEPNARLHRVAGGADGYAINIARKYYGFAADDWGQDLRFYVNVLGAVNHLDVPDSVDGWKSVGFQAGQFIWIPSQPFARGMQGVVNSGSYSYEAADAIGLADAIERAGQLIEDFQTAISLSGAYIPAAVARHVEQSLRNLLQGVLLLAAGAVVLLAVTTAVGAAIGALAGGAGAAPGAAAGFEVGLALCEWLGLGFLIAWIAQSVAAIGAAFASFIGSVWNARGDQKALDTAARQLAEAIGVTAGVAVEALVLYAAAKGIPAVLGVLRGTRFGEAIGESRLARWLGERTRNVRDGDSPLPGPEEALLRARARALATELGISPEQATVLMRRFSADALRTMKTDLTPEGLVRLAGKDPAFLDEAGRAWRSAAGDSVAQAEVIETLRLNNKGTTPNKATVQTFDAYVAFKSEFGNRVRGDFISRFRRLFTNEPRQAEAELRLARDLLEGDTALGRSSVVEGLPESTNPGERVPEYRASTPDGAKLVECKAIGDAQRPFGRNTVERNLKTANEQIRAQAAQTGEQGGLIRLDATEAAATDVSPETLATWVSNKLPSPRDSVAVDWVEILYKTPDGGHVKLTFRRDGTRFVGHLEGSW